MKVALVHDYIKEYGGAERVLEALHEIWPEVPVYTSVYLPEFLGPHRDRFKSWEIRESWVRYIPLKEKLISPLRLIAPLLFRQFDFSAFDVVIVSATGAYIPNTLRLRSGHAKKVLHVCYCHTPPRYLYGYATAREWKKNLVMRVIGEIGNHFLRIVDFKSAQNVDYFIANSKEVASRIKKFYRREAVVVYPPVSICHPEFISGSQHSKKEMPKQVRHDKGHGYYLAGGRLARPKHIDLIVRACRELNVPLKVFGKGFAGYGEEVKSHPFDKLRAKVKSTSQKSKVEFVGEISDDEKFELMRNAKAYIFASEDEDFGITPVEAMAAGTPVIAYKSGGVRESVIEGKTGIFFDELTMESLIRAIKQFDTSTIKPEACMKQAHKFSRERFQKEMKLLAAKLRGIKAEFLRSQPPFAKATEGFPSRLHPRSKLRGIRRRGIKGFVERFQKK